jgi:protease-4
LILVAAGVVWAVSLWLSPGVRLGGVSGEIGLVRIEGVMVDGRSSGGLFGASCGSETIGEQLKAAQNDPRIRAVVLRINSPGGSAVASQEIAAGVRAVRRAGKAVVAYLGDTAASGAYWVASQADKVVAAPATLTGSIGVIMQVQNVRRLFDKLGIGVEVIKSGPHKDMGGGLRELTEEERRLLQGIVDDIYHQFLQAVSEGRGLPRERVAAVADGSIFTGSQALKYGLVDELGDFELALERARQLAGLPKGAPVRPLAKPSPWEWLRSAGGLGNRTGLGPGLWLIAPALLRAEGEG